MKRFYYFVLSLSTLAVIPWVCSYFGEANLPPLRGDVRFLINLVYANLFMAYGLFLGRHNANEFPKFLWIFVWLAGLAAALAWTMPIFSGDLMEYLVRGRILGIYHESPYQHTPSEYPHDLLYAFSTWKSNPDSYGPLWVYLETIPAIIFPESVRGMVGVQKMILAVSMAGGIYFFYKICKNHFPQKMFYAATFALNPLLWVSTLLDGHNDTVMLSLTIASVYFFTQKKFSTAFFLWTLGFLVKYTVLLILPVLILLAIKEKLSETRRFPWVFVFRELFVNSLFIVAMFLPLWGGADTFLALTRASHWFYTNTIPYAFSQGLQILGVRLSDAWIKYGFLACYAAIYAWILVSLWKKSAPSAKHFFRILAVVYLAFYPTITIPFGFHYLLWALPWLVLAQWPRPHLLISLYSFAGLFSYFKRMNYLLIIAATIYFAWPWLEKFLFNKKWSAKHDPNISTCL